MTAAEHGYARYTSHADPCRCEVCRRAKADYMRARRADARANANRWTRDGYQHVAEDVQHGSRYAYEEQGCRCDRCVETRRAHDRDWHRSHRESA